MIEASMSILNYEHVIGWEAQFSLCKSARAAVRPPGYSPEHRPLQAWIFPVMRACLHGEEALKAFIGAVFSGTLLLNKLRA